jgi:hypothetical protein
VSPMFSSGVKPLHLAYGRLAQRERYEVLRYVNSLSHSDTRCIITYIKIRN